MGSCGGVTATHRWGSSSVLGTRHPTGCIPGGNGGEMVAQLWRAQLAAGWGRPRNCGVQYMNWDRKAAWYV